MSNTACNSIAKAVTAPTLDVFCFLLALPRGHTILKPQWPNTSNRDAQYPSRLRPELGRPGVYRAPLLPATHHRSISTFTSLPWALGIYSANRQVLSDSLPAIVSYSASTSATIMSPH